MVPLKALLAFLAGLILLAGCREKERPADPFTFARSPEITNAQAKLPTIKLWLGSAPVEAEVAREPKQMRTGMMFRTNLAENAGMLFVYPMPERVAFWMKNTVVPLSVAYIDPDGVIQEIHHLQPGDTNNVISTSENIQFVLEVNQNWFDRHNISTGTAVGTDRGTLRETFFPNRR